MSRHTSVAVRRQAMSRRIDLADFCSDGVRVFVGRDRGAEVRKAAKLDELILGNEPIEVVVPLNVVSITSGFFLGMFGDAIRALGAVRFRQLFVFTGLDITRVVEACVAEAVRTSSPLELDERDELKPRGESPIEAIERRAKALGLKVWRDGEYLEVTMPNGGMAHYREREDGTLSGNISTTGSVCRHDRAVIERDCEAYALLRSLVTRASAAEASLSEMRRDIDALHGLLGGSRD